MAKAAGWRSIRGECFIQADSTLPCTVGPAVAAELRRRPVPNMLTRTRRFLRYAFGERFIDIEQELPGHLELRCGMTRPIFDKATARILRKLDIKSRSRESARQFLRSNG
jgi:hypothetical protein